MRILRIITRMNVGGPAIQAVLLTEAFPGTLLVYGSLSEGEESIFSNNDMEERKTMLPSAQLPVLQREVSLIKDWKVFWKIRWLIKKYKPDIIHTHMSKAGFLGRLAGISANLFQKKKIKLVHTFHGHTFHSYFSTWKTKVFLILERWLAKRSIIICLNQDQQNDIADEYKITTRFNTRIVPLGLELKRFMDLPPARFNSGEKINVAIIGRLVSVKNHKMFLDAVKIIKEKSQINRYQFWIVGGGELEKELKDYACELKLYTDIFWRGWEYDIAGFYEKENIHLVVNTSFNEGTPVSLIEAFAGGRDVICTNFKGAQDFSQGASIIVQQNDSESLAGLIMRYPSWKFNPNYRREYFYEHYSSQRLVKDLEYLYTRLLIS